MRPLHFDQVNEYVGVLPVAQVAYNQTGLGLEGARDLIFHVDSRCPSYELVRSRCARVRVPQTDFELRPTEIRNLGIAAAYDRRYLEVGRSAHFAWLPPLDARMDPMPAPVHMLQ